MRHAAVPAAKPALERRAHEAVRAWLVHRPCSRRALLLGIGAAVAQASCTAPDERSLDLDRVGEEGVFGFELSIPALVDGENELFVRVHELSSGATMPQLQLAIEAVHLEMGHGLESEPVISPEPGGGFHVRRLALNMPGRWSIFLEVWGYDRSDRIHFDVVVR